MTTTPALPPELERRQIDAARRKITEARERYVLALVDFRRRREDAARACKEAEDDLRAAEAEVSSALARLFRE